MTAAPTESNDGARLSPRGWTRPTHAGPAADPDGSNRPSWPIVVAAAAALVVNLDTAVNIALPAISAAFGLEVADITWLVVCYVLTYACLLVTTGRLADAFGHERVLRIGLALSVVGLAGAGLAPAWGWFLGARVVQGAGAALVLGAAPALVTTSVAAEHASRALGQFQMGVAAGFAAGPPIGGLLTQWLDWRWVFLFRAPLALGLLIVVLARPTGSAPPTGERPPLDLTGTLSLGLAVAAGLLALNRGPQTGWTSPLVLVGAALVLPLTAAWVLAEGRAAAPALDPRLFRSAGFAVANLLTAAANGAMFMIWLLVPYYLITTRGHSTVVGGLLLAANPLAMALVAPLAGRWSTKVGAGRLAAGGLAVECAGLAAVSRLGAGSPPWAVAAALGLVGLGVGLFSVPNMSLVMGAIARHEQGVAGGLAQMTRTVGVVGGVAIGSLSLTRARAGEGQRLGVAATDPVTFLPAYSTVFLGAAAVTAMALVISLTRAGDRERPAS